MPDLGSGERAVPEGGRMSGPRARCALRAGPPGHARPRRRGVRARAGSPNDGTGPRGRSLRVPASGRGIALIVVLWLTMLLTVIASSFAYSMRGEALAARNALSLAQARAAADGAVDRTIFELMRPRNVADAWTPDGQPRAWKDGDIDLAVTAVDEAARIDLNFAADALLKGLLENVGGLDPDAAERVLEAILDWRDADDLRRPNGAEAADYRAAGLKVMPSNSRFESVGELVNVLGVTPELMTRIADTLTVNSRQPGINPATASRSVLRALPGITDEQVDSYIAARSAALASHLPPPPLPLGQAFLSAPSPVWRIHVQARTPDGVTFARDAVVRSAPTDPRRPYAALVWQDGVLALPSDTQGAKGDGASQNNGSGTR